MAIYTTSNAGNTALQTEIWTLTLSEANRATEHLSTHPGSYWEVTLVRPYRRARRAKAPTVRVYTAGFSTGELSNALFAAGCTVTAGSRDF